MQLVPKFEHWNEVKSLKAYSLEPKTYPSAEPSCLLSVDSAERWLESLADELKEYKAFLNAQQQRMH